MMKLFRAWTDVPYLFLTYGILDCILWARYIPTPFLRLQKLLLCGGPVVGRVANEQIGLRICVPGYLILRDTCNL